MGLSWDDCLRVVSVNEPRATMPTEDAKTDVVASWFTRGRATILMDVELSGNKLELKINHDTNPEVRQFPEIYGTQILHCSTPILRTLQPNYNQEVATSLVRKKKIQPQFLRPLTEQIRIYALTGDAL